MLQSDGASWQTDVRFGLLWRKFGLHRMRHRLDGVELSEDALTVRTRVAPAAWEIGLATVYRWTSDGSRLTSLGRWLADDPSVQPPDGRAHA